MGVRHDIPSSYWQADATLGSRSERTIGYATRLQRRSDGIDLLHHGTVIVTYRIGSTEVANDYGSVTTSWRINAALPGGWSAHNRNGTRYLFHGGYALTPLVDGLTIATDWDAPADPVVTFRGDTILTTADVDAIKGAEDAARDARAARRTARLLREHPVTGGPRTHNARAYNRRARDCERCHAEEQAERDARRAALSVEHDAGSHDRCPWDCPKRPANQGWY